MPASAQSLRQSHPVWSWSRGTDAVPDAQAILRIVSSRCSRNKIQEERRGRRMLEHEMCSGQAGKSPSFRLAPDRHGGAELLQKFFAQSVKAAVGHDEKQIARPGFRGEMYRNRIGAWKNAGVLS